MAPSGPIGIVLADDDIDLRAVTAARLRLAGMCVWEADDGSQAVALVREHRPAVLLLDLWMPKLDGLGVLDALRFDPAASRTAVVVLTGDGEADGRLYALAGGACAILLKGGPLDAIVEAVRACADRALGPIFGVALPDDEDEPEPLTISSSSGRELYPSGPDLP